jgi:hypothetical protein
VKGGEFLEPMVTISFSRNLGPVNEYIGLKAVGFMAFEYLRVVIDIPASNSRILQLESVAGNRLSQPRFFLNFCVRASRHVIHGTVGQNRQQTYPTE